MSRKKIVPNYAISLDIGNASVGWAAFTPDYRLMRAKGRELIGVRLFEPAQTAEARRMARTTRRRYSRRRWRLHMLDAIFDAPLAEVDPSFLARRKYSWVHPADENNADYWYGGVLFDSKNQDKRFYKQYPTIYHLRKTLMEDDKQHDILPLRSIASLRLCVLKIVILWKLLLIKIMVFLNGLMSRILERIKSNRWSQWLTSFTYLRK